MISRNQADCSRAIKLNKTRFAALVYLTCVLMSSSSAFADRLLTGPVALQLLAGKEFRFTCSDGMNGHGQFVHRSLAWATYRFTSNREEIPSRAEAIVWPNGNELCFRLKDFGLPAQLCSPVFEKTPGIYRFGSKDEWCELKAEEKIATD